MRRFSFHVLGALALALGVAPLSAQKAGQDAPEIVWDRTWLFGDIPAKKLSDLRGSVVLLEFWGTH
jgi:hypothetical protein